MRYLVIIETGPTSSSAYVPDLPGCVAAGETNEEVLALSQAAIEFHIEGQGRWVAGSSAYLSRQVC